MKKIFLYILAGSLCFTACKKDDDDVATFTEPDDIATRNSYDEQAIQKFMDDNYLDTQGNIRAFSSTDATDDNYKKLSELNPVKLPSGVIYIIRDGAQPSPGKTIESDSQIKTMMKASYYLATPTDGNVSFNSLYTGSILNTINDSGSPTIDPSFYYIKNSVLTAATTDVAKQRSYYEIEGLQEGLKYFKSYNDIPDGSPYNLQGVIIVPSKAAFARDLHFNYVGATLQNRCFVFNFQIYNAKTRPIDQQ